MENSLTNVLIIFFRSFMQCRSCGRILKTEKSKILISKNHKMGSQFLPTQPKKYKISFVDYESRKENEIFLNEFTSSRTGLFDCIPQVFTGCWIKTWRIHNKIQPVLENFLAREDEKGTVTKCFLVHFKLGTKNSYFVFTLVFEFVVVRWFYEVMMMEQRTPALYFLMR